MSDVTRWCFVFDTQQQTYVLASDYDALAAENERLRAIINQKVPLSDWQKMEARLAERAGEILRATLPIRVAIERADDGYVAENKRLDIFAFGDDPSGALSEFRSQLFSLYEHYTALSEDEVMGEAAEMRLLFLNKFTLLRTEGR